MCTHVPLCVEQDVWCMCVYTCACMCVEQDACVHMYLCVSRAG